MLYNFLFLLAILVLQRVDLLFTSAGFFLLIILSYFTFIRRFSTNQAFSMERKNLIYITFMFAFIYNIPIYAGDIDFASLTILITPLLVWVLLTFSTDIKYKYIFNEKILFALLFILGAILLYDFYTMFTTNTVVKKVFAFANPNYTAYLILVLEILYIFYRKVNQKNSILFFAIATFLILFTLSKTSYIIQLLIWALVLDRKGILRLGLIIGMTSFILGIIYSEVVIEVFDKMLLFFNHDLKVAVSHRERLINAAFDIYSDNLLFGCGYEQFRHIAYTQYSSGLNVKTHNILLTVLAENGTVGLVLFLSSTGLLWLYAIRDKIFRKEKMLLLFVFFAYALSHAGSQYFAFIPLFFTIVLENNRLFYGRIKC